MVFVFFAEMAQGHIVATMKAFTVFVANLWRNRGLTKFPLLLHIRRALFCDIPASGFDSIMETSALNLPKLSRRSIPLTMILVWRRPLLSHWLPAHRFLRMSKGYVIATSKSIPVVIAESFLYRGMTKFLVHFGVRGTTILHVLARSFNAIVKAMLLNLAKFLGRSIPPARMILRRRVLGGEV